MLSRSTAYHVPVDVSPSRDEINIKNAIDRIHYEEPAFGVRRIRNELHKQGFHNVAMSCQTLYDGNGYCLLYIPVLI